MARDARASLNSSITNSNLLAKSRLNKKALEDWKEIRVPCDAEHTQIFKIVTWNANGLYKKRINIPIFLSEGDIDILLISETHFTFDSFLKIPGYALYHTVHPSGNARGGAAIIIKMGLEHYLDLPYQSEEFQAVSVTVKTNMGDIRVASLYSPPKHNIKREDYVKFFEHFGQRFIVGGDMNVKHRRWGSRKTLPKGKQLEQAAIDLNLDFQSQGYPTYWPTDPKKKPDVIDFFVTKGIASNCCDVFAISDLVSDHIPVLLALSTSGLLRIKQKSLFNIKTNWDAFRQQLSEVITDNPILSNEQLDNEVSLLAIQIQNAAKSCTPPIKCMPYSVKIPKDVRELLKARRRARNTWHRTRYPGDKEAFNKINKELQKSMWEIKHNKTKEFLKGLDAKPSSDYSLWKAIRYLKNTPIHSPPIKRNDGSWAKTDLEKAEVFADHLEKVFSPNEDLPGVNLEYLDQPQNIPEIGIKRITHEELNDEIKFKVKRKKAPGRDQIGGEILKQLPGRAVGKLCKIFNYILENKYFPKVWKEAEIILIPKIGKDLNVPSSHRPISLLSVISKLWERLYLKRLKPLLIDNKAIPDHQFGFREKHSTTQQIHRVVNLIEDTLEKKRVCVAIFLDISMAFDKVWHQGLLYKLRCILPTNHCELLESYLGNRTFRVRFGGSYSKFKYIYAGIPQGSCLGPILYNLFTRDVPEAEGLTGTFADDTAALETGRDLPEATEKLQRTVNKIVDWTWDWRVALSGPKSAHVIFTNRKVGYLPILLEGAPAPFSDSAKYLGVTLDSKLRWKQHVKNKRQQLNLKFKKMYWLLGGHSPLSLTNKVLLYKQVLRPVWSYACEIWGCTRKSNRYLIEAFQSKVLRQISGAPWFVRNDHIMEELQVESVKEIIERASGRHHQRLMMHPNELAQQAVVNNPIRRLKRHKPYDLASGLLG